MKSRTPGFSAQKEHSVIRKPSSDRYIYRTPDGAERRAILALSSINGEGLLVTDSGKTFSIECNDSVYDAVIFEMTNTIKTRNKLDVIIYRFELREDCIQLQEGAKKLSSDQKLYFAIVDGKIAVVETHLK